MVPAGWRTVECVDGFDRWALNLYAVMESPRVEVSYLRELLENVFEMQSSPKLCILEREVIDL